MGDHSLENARFKQAMEFLYNRTNYETFVSIPYDQMAANLVRVRQFLDFIGAPDSAYPVIHVAGTKGKGSVCAMLEAALRRSGRKTGLFTSPHLYSVLERFQVDGDPVPADFFAETLLKLAEQWDVFSQGSSRSLSFFEWSLIVALVLFARAGCNVVILETGMGGRFDATNVCNPAVSVITSIAYDHMEQLGNTLEAIAGEKAGIIKKRTPIVSGTGSSLLFWKEGPAQQAFHAIDPDAVDRVRKVIRQAANQEQAPLTEVTGISQPVAAIPLAMSGRHQSWNAEIAWKTLSLVPGPPVSFSDFAQAVSQVQLPGRLEIQSWHPLILLDGAHNRSSAAALADTISRRWPNHDKTLLLAVSRGKDLTGMLQEYFPVFHHIVFTEAPNTPRATPSSELLEQAFQMDAPHTQLATESNPQKAVLNWSRTHQNDTSLLCVSGSFYLATIFQHKSSD